MNESRWLPIPEAPAYSISDQGQVRDAKGRIVAIDAGRANVFRAELRIRINIRRAVHQLFPDVAEAALNEPGEEWKPIPNWPDYEISNQARVRHVGKVITYGPHATRRIISPKLLKTSINNGYLVVYLSIPGSRKAQIFYVEKAVRASFPETATLPESLPDEVWLDIRGYEGLYRVSNIGRVMSLSRIIDDGQGRNRFIRPRIREPVRQIGRYPEVMLAKDGCIENILVHRLVAKTFIPNPKGLPVVHHKDEDKSNNRVENLEWTTAQGNISDWFDARSHRIDDKLIEHIAAASAAGKTPAEILAALRKGRKAEKIN
jgi:hypothetical protein